MPVGYRAVAKRRSAYAAMPVWGYRAVAKRRSAYAAMPARGYRGATEGTPRSPCSFYTAMMSGVSRRAKRRKRLRRDARGGIAPSRREGALRRDARVGYRAVAKRSERLRHDARGIAPSRERRGAYAAMPVGGIAPSREKGALTPRCPRSLCSLCPLCEPCVIETGRVEVGPTKKKGRLRRDDHTD